MSYTLGQLPSSRSTLAEKADFMEYQCFISDENRYSAISGETAMGISYDEQDINSDDNYGFEDALSEIEDRWIYSGEKYPFETLTDSLKIRDDINSKILTVIYLIFISFYCWLLVRICVMVELQMELMEQLYLRSCVQ